MIPLRDRCLHELVTLRAAEAPEATAVVATERTLTPGPAGRRPSPR